MQPTRVSQALAASQPADSIRLQGWIRTRRDFKGFSFLEINDGSCLANIQALVDHTPEVEALLPRLNTGASVDIEGSLAPSPGKGQAWEIKAARLTLLGEADAESYPLQKKRHSDEFLRTIAHLRPRTNKYGALLRIRSEAAFLVHSFFRDRGFCHVHTPIITGSDCEGAGEMFRVTTLRPGAPAGGVAPEDDFFGKEANLTVSGQLEAEPLACALGKVYTFGPTFRAENSNTARHAAEFWMIEPEMAFCDLAGNMDLAESFLKALLQGLVNNCGPDLELFARYVDPGLDARIKTILTKPVERISYREAIKILAASGKRFEYPAEFGLDLQTEHERYLCEEHVQRPVIVYDYPKSIKPFYMRQNDDGETVAAMDLLAPGTGEIIGGSQREERLDTLTTRMAELGMDPTPYWWYLELRRFGTVPHAGFGMGFERFLMSVTGVANIRDVIPFPRTPKHLEF